MSLRRSHSVDPQLRPQFARGGRRTLGRGTRRICHSAQALVYPGRSLDPILLPREPKVDLRHHFSGLCQKLAQGEVLPFTSSEVTADQAALVGFGDLYSYNSLSQFAYLLEQLTPIFGGHVLSFCLGDICGDNPWARETRGQSSLRLIRSLGAQAAVIGNHEMTLKPGELESFLSSSAQFGTPWVGANLLRPGDEPIPGIFTNGILRRMNGIQVGILGVVGDWRSEFNGGSSWIHTDAIESAKAQARLLQEAGAEMILALTHMSLDDNRDLAREVPEVDLILAGHNHVPHFEIVNNTVLLEPGQNFSHFAAVSVQLRGGHLYLSPQLLPIGEQVPQSSRLSRVMEEIEADFISRTSQRRSRRLIALEGQLDTRKFEARIQETSGGNLVADAFRHWGVGVLDHVNQNLENPIRAHQVVSFTNGGGIRKNELMEPQQITVGTVEEIITQDNTLSLLPVQGKYFQQILEAGVSGVEFNAETQERTPIDGRFLQVSGIQFNWDPSQPAGYRISQIHIHGQPIDPNQIYYVATNDFTASGGNNMGSLVYAVNETESFSPVATVESPVSMKEALVAYLEGLARQGQSSYQAPALGQRIRIIQ